MSALPKHEADSVVSELPSPKGPGARLKAAREAKNLNLEKVAAQLHLSNEMLVVLEADDYDNLPARVFVVGYLRNYARLVGLPAEAITQALDQFLPPAEQEQAVELPKVGTTNAGIFKPSKRSSFPFFKLILIFGSLLAIFWGWKQGYFTDVLSTTQSIQQQFKSDNLIPIDNQPTQNPTSEPDNSVKAIPVTQDSVKTESVTDSEELTDKPITIEEPELVVEPEVSKAEVEPVESTVVTEPETTPILTSEVTEQAETLPATEITTVSAQPETKPVISEPVATQSAPEIILSLAETCWVNVRDSAGDFRMNNNYKAGTQKKFTGTPPYKILIGNVRGATLTIDGEPFDLSGYTKKNVARLVLDPSKL